MSRVFGLVIVFVFEYIFYFDKLKSIVFKKVGEKKGIIWFLLFSCVDYMLLIIFFVFCFFVKLVGMVLLIVFVFFFLLFLYYM